MQHQHVFVQFYGTTFRAPYSCEMTELMSAGWFENVDCIFIAMEYFQYGDLHKFILHSGPCTEFGAKVITIQLLEGLGIMHQMGFAHRDLKPQVSNACKSLLK